MREARETSESAIDGQDEINLTINGMDQANFQTPRHLNNDDGFERL